MRRSVDGADARICRFGGFSADLTTSRLCHREQPIHLASRAFEVLAVLLQHAGQTVDKEQLFREVWQGLFVEENNLARHISVIRKALHAYEPDTEYIVTIAGRGYRFAAEVAVGGVAGDAPPQSQRVTPIPAFAETAPANASPDLRRGWPKTSVLWAAAVVLPLFGAMLAVSATNRWGAVSAPAAVDASPRELRQATSLGTVDQDPAWSPDGRTLAFSSDRSGNLDIWVQRIGDHTAVALTNDPAVDSQPAWSPDGQLLAFHSDRDGGGIFVVPTSGGIAGRVTSFGHSPQWSPDGKRLAFVGDSQHGLGGVYVVQARGGVPAEVRPDLLAQVRQMRAAWHPDGRVSVYGRHPTDGFRVWTMSLSNDTWQRSDPAPEIEGRLRQEALQLTRFVWSPKGDRIYFAARSGERDDIWRVGVEPGTTHWVAGLERLTTDGGRNPGLALSPDGSQIALTRRHGETRIWSFPFDPIAARLTGRGEPLTPFGSEAFVVDMSPDGQQLAYRTVRAGREELWLHTVSTASNRLAATEERAQILQPRWSADGRRLAYLRLASTAPTDSVVVLVDSRAAVTNQLLPQSRGTPQIYDWAPDGVSLLVGCENDHRLIALCTMSVSVDGVISRSPQFIANDAERNLWSARTSPNRRWILFLATADRTRTVYAMPADGGSWIQVTDGQFVDKPRWSPDGQTMYYTAARGGTWNLWGRRFDVVRGLPVGPPFQVTRFETPGFDMQVNGMTQLSITRDRLVVPITESAGNLWILDRVDR